jgi:hypothetical protein
MKINAAARLQATQSTSEELLHLLEPILGTNYKKSKTSYSTNIKWKPTPTWSAMLSVGNDGSLYFVFQPRAMRRAWTGGNGQDVTTVLKFLTRNTKNILREFGNDSKIADVKPMLEALANL